MWETTFTHASSTALPAHVSLDLAIATLHDFETVVRLSPDCRGCRQLPPSSINPPTSTNTNGATQPQSATTAAPIPSAAVAHQPGIMTHYEVEDDLPFIPKKLWSGGVKYRADFLPTADGCDITVYAPGGFTSTNHWRITRDGAAQQQQQQTTKDTEHAETDSTGGWQVQIVSDAKCPWTFASFVKGFLKNSHIQLQRALIEKLQQAKEAVPRSRRPTIGRRQSSVF